MCRVRTHELGRDTRAVAQARRAVADMLERWELPSLVRDAELLVSELVTNSVLHGRSDVTLTLAVADGALEVGVTDRSTQLPVQRHRSSSRSAAVRPCPGSVAAADWWAEGGRGLRLVDMVSDEWGIVPLVTGKQVWFRLAVDSSWPHRSACPCAGDDLERMRLESGRFAVATPGPWDDGDDGDDV
jgi:anti-sigma regulatory factor (Ser/Thr protein kinase)